MRYTFLLRPNPRKYKDFLINMYWPQKSQVVDATLFRIEPLD